MIKIGLRHGIASDKGFRIRSAQVHMVEQDVVCIYPVEVIGVSQMGIT